MLCDFCRGMLAAAVSHLNGSIDSQLQQI